MSQNDVQATNFEEVNDRLKEIVEAVSDDELPLDEALDLFDEAVALGMKASEMMEDDIATRDAADAEREEQEAAADAAADAELAGEAPVEGEAASDGAGSDEADVETDEAVEQQDASSDQAFDGEADQASEDEADQASEDEADQASDQQADQAPAVEIDDESDLGSE